MPHGVEVVSRRPRWITPLRERALWDAIWELLVSNCAALKLAHPLTPASVHAESGERWQYMGTYPIIERFEIDHGGRIEREDRLTGWNHQFRHRMEPTAGARKVINIAVDWDAVPQIPPPWPNQNARFWVYENGDWVKLTVRPGKPLQWGYSRATEEGYHSEGHEWRIEDDMVIHEATSDGRDCDGRLQQFAEYQCKLGLLPGEVPEGNNDVRCRFCQQTLRLSDDREWIDWHDRLFCPDTSHVLHVPVVGFNPPRCPWDRASASQRDEYAEAAGY
jgi:hypothetical protein